MKMLVLDLLPANITFEFQSVKSDGTVLDPTVATISIFEEAGVDATYDNVQITGSPFTPAIINAKLGNWGKLVAKSNFTAGKIYRVLIEATIDGIASAKIETYYAVNATQFMPDVSGIVTITGKLPTNNIMGSSDVDNHDTDIDSILTDTNEIQGKLPTNKLMGSSDVDNHDTDIDSILADTNEIQGKLPTNKIMGSSVVTDKDLVIDNIHLDLVALTSDVSDVYDSVGDVLLQTTDIVADTNEMQLKLPTNNIMGSSVKTNKDDEIDDIKAKTTNLPSDPASESNATTNKNTIVAAINARVIENFSVEEV